MTWRGHQNGIRLCQSFHRLHWTSILSLNTTAPNLNSIIASLTTATVLLPLPERNWRQSITAVNSFYLSLKYTRKISDTSLTFLDIKVSIKGNSLCTSVQNKPTDSHSYLLYSIFTSIMCQGFHSLFSVS